MQRSLSNEKPVHWEKMKKDRGKRKWLFDKKKTKKPGKGTVFFFGSLNFQKEPKLKWKKNEKKFVL